MNKLLISALFAGITALALASNGVAQMDGGDEEERAWFALNVGLFSPLTTFEDEMFGESSFESAPSIGVSAGAWITDRIGVQAKVLNSKPNGTNETSEFAPIAVNDPNMWSFTAEAVARQPMDFGSPYLALGAGMRHYTWEAARLNEDKFLTITGAVGAELRPAMLGPFGIVGEVRAYRSQWKQFGIHGGNWRPGTRAREGTDIGFYGGVVDRIWTNDVSFSVGVTYSY